MFHAKDEQSGASVVVIAVETIKEFSSFNYEILLQERRDGSTIHLKILGLNTPTSVMPGVGPARGIRIHRQLEGRVAIIVSKPEGEANHFEFEVDKRTISLSQMPEQPFVIFSPDPVPFQ